MALTGLVSQSVAGAKIIDLCQFGTTVLDAQLSKLYNKKVDGVAIEKGVAFPVCISVNEVICNHSPLPSEELVSSYTAGSISYSTPPLRWSHQVGNDACLSLVAFVRLEEASYDLHTDHALQAQEYYTLWIASG